MLQQETYRMTYFLRGMKGEKILVAGEQYDFPVGALSVYLMEADVSLWEKIEEKADKVKKVVGDSCPDYLPIDMYEQIREIIWEIKALEVAEPLKRLLIVMPCQAEYALAVRNREEVELTWGESKSFDKKLSSCNFGSAEREKLERIKNDSIRSVKKASYWGIWFNYLCGFTDKNTLEYLLEYMDIPSDEMRQIALNYAENLAFTSVVGKRLRERLRYAMGIDSEANDLRERNEYTEELIYGVEAPIPVKKENVYKIFPGYELDKRDRVYAVTSLSTLISQEMDLYKQEYLKLKKCMFCGRYFFTTNKEAKYCLYSNVKLNGAPCRRKAPQVLHASKNEMQKLYIKSYSNYKRWLSRIKENDISKMYKYMQTVRAGLASQMGKKASKEELKKIIDEAESIFDNWNERAKEVLKKYNQGILSEAECRGAVELPEKTVRAPLLTYWKEAEGESVKNDLDDAD